MLGVPISNMLGNALGDTDLDDTTATLVVDASRGGAQVVDASRSGADVVDASR